MIIMDHPIAIAALGTVLKNLEPGTLEMENR